MAARLDRVAALRDRVAVVPLPGGITNRNYRVTTPQGEYVARLSEPDSAIAMPLSPSNSPSPPVLPVDGSGTSAKAARTAW